jgi:hypothetical protein
MLHSSESYAILEEELSSFCLLSHPLENIRLFSDIIASASFLLEFPTLRQRSKLMPSLNSLTPRPTLSFLNSASKRR